MALNELLGKRDYVYAGVDYLAGLVRNALAHLPEDDRPE